MNYKNQNLLIAMTVIVVMAATFFVGCTKKNEEKRINALSASSEIGNIDKYLISLKKKLQSVQKGEELISVEQAQYDLGNLLNFDFGDANYPTDEFHHDTIYIPLYLSDGQVDLSQLAVTYNDAFAKVLAAYNQVELPEKSVFGISCLINQDAKESECVDVRLVLTSRGFRNPEPNCIDSTDNWHVAEQLGKCDGTCVGDDHMTRLIDAYETNRPLMTCLNGRLYYSETGVYTGLVYADEYPEVNPEIHYNRGYRLWAGYGYEVLNYCIEYPEMSYYYQNFCQIMNNETWRPQGHVIYEILDCHLESYLSINPNRSYYFFCSYSTAKPNCTDEGTQY